MDDRQNKQSIIGRDADAARGRRGIDGTARAEELAATTSEAAGGAVSGTTGDGRGPDLDIVFEREEPDH